MDVSKVTLLALLQSVWSRVSFYITFYYQSAAINVIIMSGTKQHTISLMWRIDLIKVSNIQSNSASFYVWQTQVRCKGVLCCIFTNTGHPSNFFYGASLVTVDVVAIFTILQILILRPLISCINRATAAKSTMPNICKSS